FLFWVPINFVLVVKLEWKKGKANPVVSNLRAKLRINPMPLMSVFNDGNGFPRIVLADPSGSTAEVLLYGGQVVSWKNERREELLFMSSKVLPCCRMFSSLGVSKHLESVRQSG
ncbi:Putative glucose-6-phosphate 1-epimerase, partial [Linum perenne]